MELVYEEIIDFIAAGKTLGKIIAFRPSETAQSVCEWPYPEI